MSILVYYIVAVCEIIHEWWIIPQTATILFKSIKVLINSLLCYKNIIKFILIVINKKGTYKLY